MNIISRGGADLKQEIWSLYALSELTDLVGTFAPNFSFALLLAKGRLPTDIQELNQTIETLILDRWICLHAMQHDDARAAVTISQHQFGALRNTDPKRHKDWKEMRDARSRYSHNVLKKISKLAGRLETLISEMTYFNEDDISVSRMVQKMRIIATDLARVGQVAHTAVLDELIVNLPRHGHLRS